MNFAESRVRLMSSGAASLAALVLLTLTTGVAAHAQTTFATAGGGVTASNNGVVSNPTVSVFYDSTALGDTSITAPGLGAFTSGTNIGGTSQAWGAGGYAGSTYAGTTDVASYIQPVSAAGTGFYDYRFTFSGSAGLAMAGHAMGDNEIQSVYLDGALINLTPAKGSNYPINGFANEPSAADFSGSLGSGSSHTFDIILYNHDGPTNVAFEAGSVRPVPECGLLINGASVLGMASLGLVRVRRSPKAKTLTA